MSKQSSNTLKPSESIQRSLTFMFFSMNDTKTHCLLPSHFITAYVTIVSEWKFVYDLSDESTVNPQFEITVGFFHCSSKSLHFVITRRNKSYFSKMSMDLIFWIRLTSCTYENPNTLTMYFRKQRDFRNSFNNSSIEIKRSPSSWTWQCAERDCRRLLDVLKTRALSEWPNFCSAGQNGGW